MKSDPREAYRAALVACAIVGLAEAVYVFLDAPVFGLWPVVWLDAAHAVLAAGLALWLWTRKRPSTTACDVVFLLLALPYYFIFWVAEIHAAHLGLVREPLLGHKILMMGLALLSPSSLWLGGALIGSLCLHAIALLSLLRNGGYPLATLPAEPGVTVLFGIVSIGYLVSRAHRRSIMERLAEARAQARSYQRLARLFLALRDRTNTPLQTLEIGTALLQRRCPSERCVLESIRSAIARLRELSGTLATIEDPRDDTLEELDLLRELEQMRLGRSAGPAGSDSRDDWA